MKCLMVGYHEILKNATAARKMIVKLIPDQNFSRKHKNFTYVHGEIDCSRIYGAYHKEKA